MPARDWSSWEARATPRRLAVGDGSCARLVALADWGVGGIGTMHRIGAELVRLADQDPALEAELFGSLAADTEVLLRLDAVARSASYRFGALHRWPQLAGERLDRSPALAGPSVPALASLHPDGRVRERAVRAMAEPAAFAEYAEWFIPFLVLRAADWAAPARDAARAGLVRGLRQRPRLLLPAAAMAVRLATRSRADFAIARVRAALSTAPDEIFTGFLTSSRPELRRLAAAVPERMAAAGADGLDRLAASAYADVRVLAVAAFERAALVPRAREPLADPDKTVRVAARAAAERHGIDVPARYRELAAAGAVEPGTLYGLAASAERAADAGTRVLIEARLADPRPRVRAAAIGALESVGGLDRANLLRLLRDPAARVVRAAAHRLEPEAEQLDVGPLLALIGDPNRTPSARSYVYRLVFRHSDEARMAAALTAVAGADEKFAARATEDLHQITIINILERPPELRRDPAFARFTDSFTLDLGIVPDLPERFAAARDRLDPGMREAFEKLLARNG